MAKTATETKTRKATKAATAKPTKAKRAPSAYNLWMKDNLKLYKEKNPGTAQKDAMKAVGAMWRDAPENPRRGEEPKTRTKKAPVAKSKKPADETATSEAEADPSSD
ncbi:hypothetical protein PHLGIDRAFT_36458 [Phlebiopsis gigantea 11061_1 CR5-6]|uniref:HMG box domain-containing protein n=1 Tax=Phlebiopsis gigantea (strain 11061_1 CR5-6) TaxID=745531 RepID=A0A0C3NKC0_PHLG1|nr:hypothetical protein PHLGIDRAFT_36458 [Phlebiopsis gigantea 11061_1 CR5-6]